MPRQQTQQLSDPPSAETVRPIRMHKVQMRTGLSRSTIYNLIQQGDFPAQIQYSLGPRSRAVFWDENHIEAWLAEQLARAPEEHAAKVAHQQKLQEGRREFQNKRKTSNLDQEQENPE